MTNWHVSLPQTAFIGLTDEREDARLRTGMDAGPAKMRKRHTAAVRNIAVPLVLTGAQRVIYDTFYITTLQEGTLPFDWKDPVDDSVISFRFVKPAKFEAIVGGAAAVRKWQTTLSLEILP